MSRRSEWRWRSNNSVRLVENGEQYYPMVFAAIAAAQREVLIETFILFEDEVGAGLEQAMRQARAAGAEVSLTVDGYGSANLSDAFVARMRDLGVALRMFDPQPRWFGNRINLFRRLHRKIVVVDGAVAFVGGMNFSADHLRSFGPEAKQDYAVELRGPIVEDVRALALKGSCGDGQQHRFQRWQSPEWPEPAGDRPVRVLFGCRDNHGHPTDIERLYLIAIRSARQRIVIANAYFFPGYRLLRALRQAARRGVRVQLILQGNPDLPVARFVTSTLYASLARAGIEIHEYCERPIHAKVAVIDDWATVGSSNLDPLSLSLNLEANIFVADAAFSQQLLGRLERLIEHSCRRLDPADLTRPSFTGMVLGFFAYHFSRHFPRIARAFPHSRPRNEQLAAPRP